MDRFLLNKRENMKRPSKDLKKKLIGSKKKTEGYIEKMSHLKVKMILGVNTEGVALLDLV